ncbi:MAG: DUF128 domain-containing protein [Methanosarcinales archaeon]|nr:DUF128 domain-containing protein [Methanosarcinales archaeon]
MQHLSNSSHNTHQKATGSVQFIDSVIDDLMYGVTFDPETNTGKIIANLSIIAETDLKKALLAYKHITYIGLNLSPFIKILEEGDVFGETRIPKGKCGLVTPCSITIDGVLLKKGIPVQPKFGGIVQIKDGKPLRFTDIISYADTTVDPLELLVSLDAVSVEMLTRTGTSKILANMREAPMASRDDIEKTLDSLTHAGFGGILEVGEPNSSVLDMPVGVGHFGIIVIGGTNASVMMLEEGIPTETYAISELIDISEMTNIEELT